MLGRSHRWPPHGKVAPPGRLLLRVDYVDSVLENARRFTLDHPTKALSCGWLALLLIFVVVVHWMIHWDGWVTASFTFAVAGVAFVFTKWFLTRGEEK